MLGTDTPSQPILFKNSLLAWRARQQAQTTEAAEARLTSWLSSGGRPQNPSSSGCRTQMRRRAQ